MLSESESRRVNESAINWRKQEYKKLKMSLMLCKTNKEACLDKLISLNNKVKNLEKEYEKLVESEQNSYRKLQDFIGSQESNVKDLE